MKFFYIVFLKVLAWHHKSSIKYLEEEEFTYRRYPIESYYLKQAIFSHQKKLEKIKNKLDSPTKQGHKQDQLV